MEPSASRCGWRSQDDVQEKFHEVAIRAIDISDEIGRGLYWHRPHRHCPEPMGLGYSAFASGTATFEVTPGSSFTIASAIYTSPVCSGPTVDVHPRLTDCLVHIVQNNRTAPMTARTIDMSPDSNSPTPAPWLCRVPGASGLLRLVLRARRRSRKSWGFLPSTTATSVIGHAVNPVVSGLVQVGADHYVYANVRSPSSEIR